jgi:hypothetical protein
MVPTSSRKHWPALLLAGILAGLVTTAAGVCWSIWGGPKEAWTREQAVDLNTAYEALHQARTGPNASADAAAAQRRVDDLEAQLETARGGNRGAGYWAALVGLGMTVLCGIGYLACERGTVASADGAKMKGNRH